MKYTLLILILGLSFVGCSKPVRSSKERAWIIGTGINSYRASHGMACPESLDDLVRGEYLPADVVLNPWSYPYRYECFVGPRGGAKVCSDGDPEYSGREICLVVGDYKAKSEAQSQRPPRTVDNGDACSKSAIIAEQQRCTQRCFKAGVTAHTH